MVQDVDPHGPAGEFLESGDVIKSIDQMLYENSYGKFLVLSQKKHRRKCKFIDSTRGGRTSSKYCPYESSFE